MATATLTPRQQEIQKLIDAGKTPPEIAKQLKITDNAVYQQLRRMRKGGAKTAAKRSARKTTGRKSSRRPRPSHTERSMAVQLAQMTPLQAIRARRSDIEAKLHETSDALKAAETALGKAREAHGAAEAKSADELKQLATAERALRGESKPKPARAAAKRSTNGAQAAQQPAAATPEPEATPAPTPEPQPQAAPEPEPAREPEPALIGGTPGSEERPGVPSLPEFEQEPDGFGEDA